MNIALFSDLHFEWHRDFGCSFIDSMDPTGVDVLVLAGDVDSADHLSETLPAICKKYPEVVFVAGNHEHYSDTGANMEQVKGQLHRAAKGIPNLHWLEGSSVEIDGVRFVGATLWFPEPPPKARKKAYPDFQFVPGCEPWVYNEHAAAARFLASELRSSDVLVTHFYPLRISATPEFYGHPLNCFFYGGEDTEEIIRKVRPRLVLHGHTHVVVDRLYAPGCRVVCNPFGYMHELTGFDNHKVISV